MAVFPPEIITEILVRLPVKPLLRLCSVSKLWCALIKDPYFIKFHLERSITTKSNRSVYLGYSTTLISLNLTDFRNSIKLEFPNLRYARILGCCNGILLLKIMDTVALFNPTTRQYRVLTRYMDEYAIDYYRDRSVHENYGFGYDSDSDDYKVIRVIIFDQFSRFRRIKAEIFSLRSNLWRWRKIKKVSYPFSYEKLCGVHLNGRLHNIISFDANLPDTIVSFNVGTEECDNVSLPDLDKSYYRIAVEVFDECLCVVPAYREVLGSYRCDFWVIKEYGAKESWVKLFTYFPPHPHAENYIMICPLAFSKNGEEVLLNIDSTRLIWYDPERKSVRDVKYFAQPHLLNVEFGEYHPFCVAVGVESLVPLH